MFTPHQEKYPLEKVTFLRWGGGSVSGMVRDEDNPESLSIKFKAQGASILTLFPRALYPGNYFYLFPSHCPSFGKNPEI